MTNPTTNHPPRTTAEQVNGASQPTSLVTDSLTVLSRELRPFLRDPFSIVFSLVQPLVFLGLFAPLLPDVPGTGSTLQWFVPGIVVMSCLFATSTTGANLLNEMMTGSHERMLVTPLRRPALLIGRALKEIVPTMAQALVIVAVCLPFGLRVNVLGVAVGLLVLALLGVGLGALSFSLALASKDTEWMFWMVQQTLLFPLMLLAGILLPLDGGPGWLQTAATVNPLTHVVDAERALFAGDLLDPSVGAGLLAAALVAAVGLWVGTSAMRRSS